MGARGLWIEIICLAHQSEPYGELRINGKPVDPSTLARLVGAARRDVVTWLTELEEMGVFSRTEDGAVYSRRMVRDFQAYLARAEGGKEGAEHGAKGAVHGAKGGRPPIKERGDSRGVSVDNEKPPSKPPTSPSTSSSVVDHPPSSPVSKSPPPTPPECAPKPSSGPNERQEERKSETTKTARDDPWKPVGLKLQDMGLSLWKPAIEAAQAAGRDAAYGMTLIEIATTHRNKFTDIAGGLYTRFKLTGANESPYELWPSEIQEAIDHAAKRKEREAAEADNIAKERAAAADAARKAAEASEMWDELERRRGSTLDSMTAEAVEALVVEAFPGLPLVQARILKAGKLSTVDRRRLLKTLESRDERQIPCSVDA